jgi:hypothetical protein
VAELQARAYGLHDAVLNNARYLAEWIRCLCFISAHTIPQKYLRRPYTADDSQLSQATSKETLNTLGALLAIDRRRRPPATATSWILSLPIPNQRTADHENRLAPFDGCAKVLLNGRPATPTIEPADDVGTAGSPATTWT